MTDGRRTTKQRRKRNVNERGRGGIEKLMRATLLIVEDEERLRSSLQEYFEREGFTVAAVGDGAEALTILGVVDPDLIILDVQLPSMDGLEVCQAIRQQLEHPAGILMISGIKRETVDRVVGLEVSADVYMTKPFETRELLAQVRALLRRIKAESGRDRAAGWLTVDNHLRIHLSRRLVEAAGQEVHLTRAVNTCIAKLRAKIEPDPANPRYIQSVHGVGYRFKGP